MPSPALSRRIQVVERSNNGWMTTAMLFALLNRPGLSQADKSWIKDKIGQRQEEYGESTVETGKASASGGQLVSSAPSVHFDYQGISEPFTVGVVRSISIDAKFPSGKKLPVTCELPTGGHAALAGSRLSVYPSEVGIRVLRCNAGGASDLRLLRFVSN